MRLLIKAELFRIWNRPLNFIAVAVGAFFALFPIVFWILSRLNPAEYNIQMIWYTGFPDGLWNILQRGIIVLPWAMAALAAGTAGEDYSAGTLKIVLPRVSSRTSYMLAKHIAVIGACFAYLLVVSCISVALGLLVRIIVGMSLIDGNAEVGVILGAVLFMLMQCMYIGSIGIFVVTLTRSQVLGVFLALVAPIFMAVLTMLPGGRFLPNIHLDVMQLSLLPFSRFSTEELASVMGVQPSVSFSIVLVLVWCILFSGASFVLFQRRDVR